MRLTLSLVTFAAVTAVSSVAVATVFDPVPLETETSDATLSADDPVDDDGRHFDRYTTTLEAGTSFRIWAVSDVIDTYIEVVGPDGTVEENDDFGGTTDSALHFTPTETGTYEIRLTSYSPGEQGSYQIGVTPLDPSSFGTVGQLDGSIDAALVERGAGPGTNMGGTVWYELAEGDRVRLRVTSASFDTVALLVGPDGNTWYNDDAHDTGPDGTESAFDSTIEAIAPVAGVYQLMVFPYGGDGAGTFNVRSSVSEPVTIDPALGRPAVGYAGSEQLGRMYGMFIGLSDYQGEGSDLYGCADDATFAALAFRERGLMSIEDQVVLTDSDATVEATRAGLAWLVEQSGPDDVVVIFYSGHGGIVPSLPGEVYDFDGTDETLVLYDGDLRDSTLADDVLELQANAAVLAIDACQAGGFQRDWVSAPGRVGIFSSDEDVLSDTAEPHLAGGYLSYWFREAVLGHADGRPGDGALQSGELTDYIVEGFHTSHGFINDPTDPDPYQRVVIDRGSVSWSDVLWLYPRNVDGSSSTIPDVCTDTPLDSAPAGAGNTCRNN